MYAWLLRHSYGIVCIILPVQQHSVPGHPTPMMLLSLSTSMIHWNEQTFRAVQARMKLVILILTLFVAMVHLTTIDHGLHKTEYYIVQTSACSCTRIFTWQTSSRIRCALSCYRYEYCPAMWEGFTHVDQTCYLCLSCDVEEPLSIVQIAHPLVAIREAGNGLFLIFIWIACDVICVAFNTEGLALSSRKRFTAFLKLCEKSLRHSFLKI